MILSCNHVKKSFGINTILKDAVFHINEHEKAAIVGINGAGKTTLLRIIMGEEPADEGSIIIGSGVTVGYLAQQQEFEEDKTLYDAMMDVRRDVLNLEVQMRKLEKEMQDKTGEELEQLLTRYANATHAFEQADGYAIRSEVTGVLKGLGFSEDDFPRYVHTFSGGQKTRASLGRLLLTKPDLIILDEPTNHLDMTSIAWLETFLRSYPGSVLIVSHDRYFLNKIVSKVIEIEAGNMTVYKGNYSDYSAKKEQLRAAALKAYMNQQAEIKHQEEVIAKLKSFNREKSIKRAESREKMLAKTERLEKPMVLNDSMHIEFHPAVQSGNDVMTIRGLAKSFDDLKLFEDVDIDVRRGERLAIIGDNGTGKTTLLKIINEMQSPDRGEIIFGSKVHVGYYDQEQQLLDEDKTLFEELSDAFPQLTNTEIRNLLAAFLFTDDDVFKMIRDLSGGERGRVSLAKLMLSDANFLILDEPTNHLDIVSKEILENALNHYTGTVLFVSHDRYFINQTATRILALHDRQFVNFIGNYDYYVEKKDELFAAADKMRARRLQLSGAAAGGSSLSGGGSSLTGSGSSLTGSRGGSNSSVGNGGANGDSNGSVGDGRQEWLAAKEEQARARKRASDLKKTEDRIEKLEERNDEINDLLTREEIFTNTEKLIELNQEQKAINEELEVLYERWEELSSD